jgi:hypothetical protein
MHAFHQRHAISLYQETSKKMRTVGTIGLHDKLFVLKKVCFPLDVLFKSVKNDLYNDGKPL